MSNCTKKKLDKIKAMMIVANSQKATQKHFNRRETRFYYCDICKCWHTTSKSK